MARRACVALGTVALTCAVQPACRKSRTPEPLSIRLVDLYRPDVVEGRQAAVAAPPRLEWRFGEGDAHGSHATGSLLRTAPAGGIDRSVASSP